MGLPMEMKIIAASPCHSKALWVHLAPAADTPEEMLVRPSAGFGLYEAFLE
jgi:hypothetical protein